MAKAASDEVITELCEVAPLGIAVVDQSLRFVWVNDALCNILGYSRDEFLTLKVMDISHPETRNEETRERFVTREIEHVTLEKRQLTKAGDTRWVHINACVFRPGTKENEYGALFVEDISDRVTQERELAGQVSEAMDLLARLTPREKEILDHVTAGKTFVEIAEILYISKRTVESHAASAYRKLGVNGREAAAEKLAELQRAVDIRTSFLSASSGFASAD